MPPDALKSEFARFVVHSINQPVAGRAKHPHLFRPPHILVVSALSKALIARLMGHFNYTTFATSLARTGRVRVRAVEASVHIIGRNSFFCSRPVNLLHCWATQVKCTDRSCVTGTTTVRRTQPFIVLTWPDWKILPALPTIVSGFSTWMRIFLSPPRLTSARAKFSMQMRPGQISITLNAARFSNHEDVGLLQRCRSVHLRVGKESNRGRAHCQRHCG